MGLMRNRGVAVLGFLLTVLIIAIPETAGAQVPAPSSALSSDLSVKVSPEGIQMGAFYDGAKMRIEGAAPSGSQVLVIIRGEEHDELFNKKGRVGPIWVNTDRIHVAFTPSLFLSFSGADVTTFLDPASIEAYQLDEQAIKNRLASRSHCKCSTTVRHHTWFGAIAKCAGVEPDPKYQELIRNNYLALKSGEGRYQTHLDAVRMTNAGLDRTAGDSRYSVNFDWPRSAPPGSYDVEVYACQNRKVAARTTTRLQVVEVGFPARMDALSSGHPLGYGLLAILAAVVAGFTIDALTVRLRRRSWRNPPSQGSRKVDLSKPEPATPTEAVSHHAPEHEPVHHP
ncbi:MAG: TIGR02186 family protein [Acidobacteriia bacterium]|nr:TIGR02186 family protein [Terriglobia bacterium]